MPGLVIVSISLLRREIGVFRSDDYGVTWITKTHGMTDTNVRAIAIHPNNPQTMLAGTLNSNLFYSLDCGDNWMWSANINDTVARTYFNPYEPLQAWVATKNEVGKVHLFRSTNLTN